MGAATQHTANLPDSAASNYAGCKTYSSSLTEQPYLPSGSSENARLQRRIATWASAKGPLPSLTNLAEIDRTVVITVPTVLVVSLLLGLAAYVVRRRKAGEEGDGDGDGDGDAATTVGPPEGGLGKSGNRFGQRSGVLDIQAFLISFSLVNLVVDCGRLPAFRGFDLGAGQLAHDVRQHCLTPQPHAQHLELAQRRKI
eukprot:gene19585-16456_t